jgi:CO/xanthine dehydrogenase Mo-binding subunit
VSFTRRQFLKITSASGVVLTFASLDFKIAKADTLANEFTDWSDQPGVAKFRADGIAKVTGQKIYARDFQAKDIPGWPKNERYAFVLRSNFADAIYSGFNLTSLPEDLRPTTIVTAEDLLRDGIGIASDEFPEGSYLVSKGVVPTYLGQPVAILIFDSRKAMYKARALLMSNPDVVIKGASAPTAKSTLYKPEANIIRVVKPGNNPYDDRVVFSQLNGGPVSPSEPGERNALAMANRRLIDQMLAGGSSWKIFRESYTTQMTDPMFMEAESGLAWYQGGKKTLHLVLGSQSPETDALNSSQLFQPKNCKFKVNTLDFTTCQLGGGFGGRDSSIFCLYLSIAAAYSDQPVRILQDRYEQFQSGLKRHPAKSDLAIGITPDGKFQAIQNYVTFNAGGRKNISPRLAEVASVSATSAYDFPLVDINTKAISSTAVVSGSVRGFGVPQAVFSVECLVDEIAEQMAMDPIDLRRKNILHANWAISTGAKVAPPGLDDMCKLAQASQIWKSRNTKSSMKSKDVVTGAGFAVTMKNYGTGSDPVFAGCSIAPDGKITVTTHAVEMGTGMETTVAMAPARILGSNAENVVMGEMELFKLLGLKGSPVKNIDDPKWTPIVFGSSKASMTSSRTVFGIEQSCEILFELGVLPAAKAILGKRASSITSADFSWQESKLVAQGFRPLAINEIAKKIYQDGLVSAVINHGFYRGGWAEADFVVNGKTIRKSIDALGVIKGGKKTYEIIERKNLKSYPEKALWARQGQTMSAAACLISVDVNTKTGHIQVKEGVHYLAPGRILQQSLLEGQMEGAFAEGLGYALLEDLPLDASGPSNGFWNLGQYQVPLAQHCAVGKINKVILPAISSNDPARGIAEAAVCPVAPAIANAVSNAIGVRLRDLPITPEKVLAALKKKNS